MIVVLLQKNNDGLEQPIAFMSKALQGAEFVKFGNINSHSPMRGHMGHPEASQGDLENQPIL
jgi:hypothetical protein